jgi:prepilin-type N-terminal cleavage/methylation domain-containing protein
MRPESRARGFTLLEMLMVVLFTGILLTFAANFTLDITHASRAALEGGVDLRRATGVLDRIARDLEAAVLVKKPEALDPLEHPWLFFAEARTSDGADRLRFQARNHRPRGGAVHESDRVDLAYWLVPAEEGEGYDLLRWASARPPAVPLERGFPRRDDPGVERLASNVAHFAVLLQNEDGAWLSGWDSASPAQSSLLPIGAQIDLALLPALEDEEAAFGAPEPEAFSRRVVLALEPLDLEKALAGGDDEEDEEGEEGDELACVTVRECESRNQAAVNAYLSSRPDLRGILDSIADQCWQDHAASFPVQVANCE